jgi:catechol 2,3-dioxygenase-like lactoylglutathione lyase family enzyme
MAVRRIKPNILSSDFEASREFYNGVIGLPGGHGLDWIIFFGTEQREVQLSVMGLDARAGQHPQVSIEVDDVDEVYARAVAAGAEITYPITDEDWGLRRFFVRDPDGAIINVTQHGGELSTPSSEGRERGHVERDVAGRPGRGVKPETTANP